MNQVASGASRVFAGGLGWVACVLALLAAPMAGAQDANRGREIYGNHCGSCHYQRVHERPRDRSLVKSRDDLVAQVRRWAAQTGRTYSDEDIRDVVEHLNRSHYQLNF